MPLSDTQVQHSSSIGIIRIVKAKDLCDPLSYHFPMVFGLPGAEPLLLLGRWYTTHSAIPIRPINQAVGHSGTNPTAELVGHGS
jgi:hypothetical protein